MLETLVSFFFKSGVTTLQLKETWINNDVILIPILVPKKMVKTMIPILYFYDIQKKLLKLRK